MPDSDSWHWEGGAPWSWTGWGADQPTATAEGCLSIEPGELINYRQSVEFCC